MTAKTYNFKTDHFPTNRAEWSVINNEFNRIVNSYTDTYGDEEDICCWRLNNTVEKDKVYHYKINGKVTVLNPCQLGFVQAHKCYTKQPEERHNYNTRYRERKNKLTISHICGNSLCKHNQLDQKDINIIIS